MENQDPSQQPYEPRPNAPREKSERTYRVFRSIYDFTMATLILGCGVLMLGAKWFHLDMIINAGADFRYILEVYVYCMEASDCTEVSIKCISLFPVFILTIKFSTCVFLYYYKCLYFGHGLQDGC